MSAASDRREAVERALVHHRIDYSPPEAGGRSTWIIRTGLGSREANLGQAEWYCLGLADAERRASRQPAPPFEVVGEWHDDGPADE